MTQSAILIGSPKQQNSTSYFIASTLKSMMKCDIPIVYEADYRLGKDIFSSLLQYEQLIFIFPLYNDTLPANLIAFMEQFEPYVKRKKYDIYMYAISNAGFLEGMQNAPALQTIKNYCTSCTCTFGGGLGIGAGSRLPSLGDHGLCEEPYMPIQFALAQLSTAISSNKIMDIIYVQPSISTEQFLKDANYHWDIQFQHTNLSEEMIWKQHKF